MGLKCRCLHPPGSVSRAHWPKGLTAEGREQNFLHGLKAPRAPPHTPGHPCPADLLLAAPPPSFSVASIWMKTVSLVPSSVGTLVREFTLGLKAWEGSLGNAQLATD